MKEEEILQYKWVNKKLIIKHGKHYRNTILHSHFSRGIIGPLGLLLLLGLS